MSRYSDLHCHNHSHAYLWLKPFEEHYRSKGVFHPWTVLSPNVRKERKAKGSASAYSQCDLVRAWNGNVKLTFNSLYPMEKGFFKMPSTVTDGDNKFLRNLVKIATSEKLPLRDIMQVAYMRIPDRMVDIIQSPGYDYWKALTDEYQFAVSKNGLVTKNEIVTPGLLRQLFESQARRRKRFSEELNATGSYLVPKNRTELKGVLQSDTIAMILTIEGGHSLGTDAAAFATYAKRVDTIKKEWALPVFFITFAHHFYNFLCGQAHSIPDVGRWLFNQDEGLKSGFTAEGWKIIRKLLAIDQNNKPAPHEGYRILIDLKHMNAKSRQEYYEQIVNPCFDAGDVIPVIASHCGYSGRATLNDHMKKLHEEKDEYFDETGMFNAWNINMCDEDIKMIFKTDGLFGLSFDQRILGVPKAQKESNDLQNNILALWKNIKGVVEVIYKDNNIAQADKKKIWNCITIGTDFEGLIDPINKYNSTLDFKTFREDFIHVIDTERINKTTPAVGDFASRAQVEAAVDKFCFGNAEEFVVRNYPM